LAVAVDLAKRLPKRQRVLLVDADPQANATLIMTGGQVPEGDTLTDVMLGDATARDAIVPTRIDRLDLLPADARLADLTVVLANELGREHRLRVALRSVEDSYGACIVDAPPQLSLLTVNILSAVSELLVPIDPGLFAVAGLGRLQETVSRVRHHLEHPDLAIAGLLLTRASKTKVATDLEHQLREAFGSLVYRAVVPVSAAVEEAHANYRSIMEWAPDSPAGKAYSELVGEILSRGKSKGSTRKRRPGRGNAA
jgi:chromosome partitioning protein